MSSDAQSPTEPLRFSISVGCSAEHAFDVWTNQISLWWPLAEHSTGKAMSKTVVIEPQIGGRIYETTMDGIEYDWGEILTWSPPTGLSYLWHIGTDRSNATEVEVIFDGQADGSTLVNIEHRGWEHLGQDMIQRRSNNVIGWNDLIPHYVAACTSA